MSPFDCLARDCSLFGPHLLEASAGTGKTFAIEHIYLRLVLEGMEVEEILAITFTRAAARELKARIRANLEKTLLFLHAQEASWDYLHPHLGSLEAIQRVTDALAGFEQSQIFTIHGFCYRMLQEFAFEAHLGFSLPNPDEGARIPERLTQAARDYLEHGIRDLCPEQIASLFSRFQSMDEMVDCLLRSEDSGPTVSFSEQCAKCKAALHLRGAVSEEKLLADFWVLEPSYKKMDGDLEAQVRALANLDVRTLLRERGTLFAFFDPANKKVRAKETPFLHYPGFFDWARTQIAPILQQKVWPTLLAQWRPIAAKIMAEEEALDPDEILLQMQAAVSKESFAELIRNKYKAAIIDEFQDTDAMQWEIFQRLFLEKPLRALYLVGDPKQSIYRFRKADIYTYLEARELLGEEHLYHLDTNFRSSEKLVGALNALFARDWLSLPKLGRTLPYHPVKAGAKIEAIAQDKKGALHFMIAEGEPGALFDDVFLPYAVREIEKLRSERCAILVKDRYQAERALDLLRSRGMRAVAKSHTPLGQTEGFQAVQELFEAVFSPHDPSAAKIVMAGPFASAQLPFAEYRALLAEEGLVSFARAVLKDPILPDVMQIFEQLLAWEKKEGFSFEGLKRYLTHLRQKKADQGGARRMEVDAEAVQVMTMHISKGLEFDVVFALGLMSRTPETEEADVEAEKLRQLYVAMTRAKKRLYVPIALSKKEALAGTHSPMELFCRHLEAEGPLLERLEALTQHASITTEILLSPFVLEPCNEVKPELPVRSSSLPAPLFTPCFLSSFTTLAKEKEGKKIASPTEGLTLQTMPRGAETGIAIHQIFEHLFGAARPIWRDPSAIDVLIEEELRFSPLKSWTGVIQEMVKKTLAMPLQTEGEFFSLSELQMGQLQVEAEFVFSSPPHFVKGFIDLVFRHRGKIYFLDWKTNWLTDYGQNFLQEEMQRHDYELQATLYAEAIQRHFLTDFGGAFYVFVRGPAYLYTRGEHGTT